MFARSIIPTTRVASRLAARRAHTVPPKHSSNPVSAFFREVPMPVEAYPLALIVVTMVSFASYSAYKHIREDRDHLRWYSGAGVVRYVEPELKAQLVKEMTEMEKLPVHL